VDDAADDQRHERQHVAHRVRHRVHLEAGVVAVDADRELIGRLAAAVDADGRAELLGLGPDDVEARVAEVLVADVLRRTPCRRARAR
jgi:hypothetical protein